MTSLLLALALALPAGAQAPAEGHQKYDAGDFNGAAAVFTKSLEAAPRDPFLHYDLGNALFKAGKLGPAIASYQRAFDIKPRDADIRYNLEFALKRAGEELRPEGTPPALFYLFTLLSERELAGLHWLFCWAALLLASAWVLKPLRREELFLPLAVCAALWLGAGAWWGSRRLVEPEEMGVIVRSTAELKSGPGENFNVTFTAPEGRRVQILSESAGWLEIGILKEGAKGWLPAAAVEKI
jgi:tetratricopeptide (TPR) repeat protein